MAPDTTINPAERELIKREGARRRRSSWLLIGLGAAFLSACAAPPVPPAPAITVMATARAAELRVPVRRIGNNGHSVPVAIAGICCVSFLIDSGASDVAIPPVLFEGLVKGGHIKREDMFDVVTYVTASGKVEGLRFRMPPMTVGGVTLRGVTGSVTPGANILLLGQSFLQRFRSWSIDNETSELVLR